MTNTTKPARRTAAERETIAPNANVVRAVLDRKRRASYGIEGHKGLTLEARADGEGSYVIRYRVGGKQREKVLHDDARRVKLADIITAKDNINTAAKLYGRDLIEDRRAEAEAARAEQAAKAAAEQAASITLGTVIDAWIKEPRDRTLRPRTVDLYRRTFDLYVMPALGSRPIASITKTELAQHFAAVTARLQKSGGRDGKGVRGEAAGKAFTYLQAVFEFAVDREHIARNPMRGLSRPVPKQSDVMSSRPLRPEELRKLWQGLDAHASPSFTRMIRLALLLGRRRAEIALAAKSELRLDDAEPHWIVPPREGNKSATPSLVPLPTMAANILRHAVRDAEGSAYVFPQSRGPLDQPTRPDPLSHAWRDACNALGIDDAVNLHDARSLITDALEVMGVPDNIVSHVLHHTADMKSTTAKRTYSTNSFRVEKHRALEMWERRLLAIVNNEPVPAERW